ncbi:MAG: sulfatase family protein [Planctomycetota bacterium]|jgi:arylsulfatase A-like enzyme
MNTSDVHASGRQSRRLFLQSLGIAAASLLSRQLEWCSAAQPQERPPNIVVIFTDDQGYSDVGSYGARDFETPHLDRMAAEGVRFTDFYVAQPVCSASRAALLTGCYPNRIGITGALWPGAEHGIHDREVTLGELCRSRGYATAIFGKWHLGHQDEFLPPRHGFDEFCGIPYSNDMWPMHPDLVDLPPDAVKRKRGYPELPLIEGATVINDKITPADQARFTTLFTDRATAFIRRNKERPFLLYLAHPMPHVPLFVSNKFRGRSKQGLYGDVMMEIDWSVGQILTTLREVGVDENTLVLFITDNGPWLSYGNHAGSCRPLREGKGTTWEGGVRVPCIARWPGRIPENTIVTEPAMTIDVFPTVARLIGAELPAHKIDGKDIWPLMAGTPGARSPHEALYFYYHANNLEAVRSGKWKLVFPHKYRSLTDRPGRDGKPNGYSHPTCGLELYDLSRDIGERHNVAGQYPEVVERLQALAERARDDLGDKLTNRTGRNVRPPGRIKENASP